MQVNRPGGNDGRIVAADRQVLLLPLDRGDGEVVLGHREARLQQPLVDRSELPHRQRPEVNRSFALGSLVDQQPRQRRSELCVGQLKRGERRTRLAHFRIVGEEAAVVGGNAPAGVAFVHCSPDLLHVVPQGSGVFVVVVCARLPVRHQPTCRALERMDGVVVVGSVREKVLVLGVSHEQQPEQDHHHLLVGVFQIGTGGVAPQPSGDGTGEGWHRLEVNTFTQPHRELRGEVGRAVQDRLQGAVFDERVC